MSEPVLGIIGVGELALYTIRGLRQGGYEQKILLGPRNNEKSRWLAQHMNCEVKADNQAVVDHSDLIMIATRPPQCLQALAGLKFKSTQTLISVVAGIPREHIRAALNQPIEIVRAMPVSSAEVGASPALVFPAHPEVCQLFAHCGEAIPVTEESTFESGTVHACAYSWFFALFEELIQATESAALPRELATQLVAGMARGAAELTRSKPELTPGQIASEIATEGTYSRLGLELIKKNKGLARWHEACALLSQKLDIKF